MLKTDGRLGQVWAETLSLLATKLATELLRKISYKPTMWNSQKSISRIRLFFFFFSICTHLLLFLKSMLDL